MAVQHLLYEVNYILTPAHTDHVCAVHVVTNVTCKDKEKEIEIDRQRKGEIAYKGVTKHERIT